MRIRDLPEALILPCLEIEHARRPGDLSLADLPLWMLIEDSGAIAVEKRSFVAKG